LVAARLVAHLAVPEAHGIHAAFRERGAVVPAQLPAGASAFIRGAEEPAHAPDVRAELDPPNVDEALVRPMGAPDGIGGSLPDEGVGSLAALRTLIDAAEVGATRSAGPRFFHFVMGGGTPAALAADWLASALDQIAFNWVSSPLAMQLEQVSVGWLKEFFGLPAEWSGVL